MPSSSSTERRRPVAYKDGARLPGNSRGVLTCKSGTGNIYYETEIRKRADSRRICHPLHAERTRTGARTAAFLQGRYEIQISIHLIIRLIRTVRRIALRQYAPLVNVTRAGRAVQNYDIIFHAQFAENRSAIENYHARYCDGIANGVLVQDHVTIQGRTTSSDDTDPCEDGPLMLQDISSGRQRNIYAVP